MVPLSLSLSLNIFKKVFSLSKLNFYENVKQLFRQLVIIKNYFGHFVETIKVKNTHCFSFVLFFVSVKLLASRDIFEHHRYYLFFDLEQRMLNWSHPAGFQANSSYKETVY